MLEIHFDPLVDRFDSVLLRGRVSSGLTKSLVLSMKSCRVVEVLHDGMKEILVHMSSASVSKQLVFSFFPRKKLSQYLATLAL